MVVAFKLGSKVCYLYHIGPFLGFKMSCMKELTAVEPLVSAVSAESLVSTSAVVKVCGLS